MFFHPENCFCSHQNNANRGGALVSDDESDEGEEGDYTVYECPGLATVFILLTGLNESLVKNYKNYFMYVKIILNIKSKKVVNSSAACAVCDSFACSDLEVQLRHRTYSDPILKRSQETQCRF